MSEATALTAAEGASPWLLHLLKYGKFHKAQRPTEKHNNWKVLGHTQVTQKNTIDFCMLDFEFATKSKFWSLS